MRPSHGKVGRSTPRVRTPLKAQHVLAAGIVAGASVGGLLLVLWPRSELASVQRRANPGTHDLTPAASDDAGEANEPLSQADTRSRTGRPRAPLRLPPLLESLTTMYDWPVEPPAPERVDERRLAEALAMLCNVGADSVVRSWYAGWITTYARELGVDPFLLAGLMAARSRCDDARPSPWLGLTGLAPELYEADVRGGRYHYRAFVGDAWVERSLTIGRFPFTRAFISAPESNLYFAAAFLKSWQEQQRGLFVSFAHADYRHYVSHFVWGDHVQSNRQEDQILVERRRLLEYYGAREPMAPVPFGGVALGCPLDGCPRVITSTLGDSREGGKREHRGVDFESTEGEPVRAVADGKVLFAGADLPGAAHRGVPIYAQQSVARSLFGAGGIYVCIEHATEGAHAAETQRVLSCSMHLQTSLVEQGRQVKRGDIIGRVGKTGIKESAPHLHFELHAKRRVFAANEVMRGMVLGTPRNTPR